MRFVLFTGIFLSGVTSIFSTPPATSKPESLSQLDALFAGYFAWFGSMYDRRSGGAYFSLPGREQPEKFPPHIESTSKLTNVLKWSERINQVPDGTRAAMIHFIKAHQVVDPQHAYYGFFLDPNYPRLNPAENGASVNERAAARALGFSLNLLTLFDATSDVPPPDPNRKTKTLAHLQSERAFKNWLDARPWAGSPWTVGSDIVAQTTFIDMLSEPLKSEILRTIFDDLPSHQNPKTGFWGASHEDPYFRVSGAHKIALFYTHYNEPIPHADALMATVLSIVDDTPATNLLYCYNSSQLVANLQKSLTTPMTDDQKTIFVARQTSYLADFLQSDGGFSRVLSGKMKANEFHPATDAPFSDTDVAGLALKARNALHQLVLGTVPPLANASDPKLFGMTGLNSEILVKYKLSTSRSPESAPGIVASDFGKVTTRENPKSEPEFLERQCIFTVTPPPTGLDLYFLALRLRWNSEGQTSRALTISYSLDNAHTFKVAGRTTISPSEAGAQQRDIPLLTLPDLTNLKGPVQFRISVPDAPQIEPDISIESVELFGVITPRPSSSL